MWLGIDIGTGGSRALLVDARGGVRAGYTAAHEEMRMERPLWAEQRPENWWDAAVEAVRGVLAKAGVSAQVPQDPVTNAPLRDVTELLLHRLQSSAGLPHVTAFRQFHTNGEDRGEPSDRARQVNVFEKVFTPVALQVRDQRAVAAPRGPRPRQCS